MVLRLRKMKISMNRHKTKMNIDQLTRLSLISFMSLSFLPDHTISIFLPLFFPIVPHLQPEDTRGVV